MRETYEHAKITPVSSPVITYRAIVHIDIATFLISTYWAVWNRYLHGFPTLHCAYTCGAHALYLHLGHCLPPSWDEILHYYTILQYIWATTSVGWCLSLSIMLYHTRLTDQSNSKLNSPVHTYLLLLFWKRSTYLITVLSATLNAPAWYHNFWHHWQLPAQRLSPAALSVGNESLRKICF